MFVFNEINKKKANALDEIKSLLFAHSGNIIDVIYPIDSFLVSIFFFTPPIVEHSNYFCSSLKFIYV